MPEKVTYLLVVYRIEDGSFTTEERSLEIDNEEELKQIPEKLKDLFPQI